MRAVKRKFLELYLQDLRSLSEELRSRVTKYLAIRKNLFRLADPDVIIKVDTSPDVIIKVDTSPKKQDSEKVLRLILLSGVLSLYTSVFFTLKYQCTICGHLKSVGVCGGIKKSTIHAFCYCIQEPIQLQMLLRPNNSFAKSLRPPCFQLYYWLFFFSLEIKSVPFGETQTINYNAPSQNSTTFGRRHGYPRFFEAGNRYYARFLVDTINTVKNCSL